MRFRQQGGFGMDVAAAGQRTRGRTATRTCARPHRVLRAALVACLTTAVATHAANPVDLCATAKIKAAGKKAASELKCYASAVKGERAVDLGCIAKAEQAFASDFAKAEAKGACATSGDAAAVERDVDACVASLATDQRGDPGSPWTPLVGRAWSVPVGTETFKCRRIRVPLDTYVTGFRPVSPAGTFETLVTVSPSTSTPLGDYDCSAANLDDHLIYAAGPGTGDFVFPLGAGVRLHAGDYVNLVVHLVGDPKKALTGVSGVLVRTGTAADVVNDAELVLAGTFNINLPPDGLSHTAAGGCSSFPGDAQVLGLWPHLFSLGTHTQLVVTPAMTSTPQTVLDVPYTVAQQAVYPSALTLHTGDAVRVTCTYVNHGTHTVTFSESATGEHCFVGLYLYGLTPPASLYACVDQ